MELGLVRKIKRREKDRRRKWKDERGD